MKLGYNEKYEIIIFLMRCNLLFE